MKFVAARPFADPEIAARKLLEPQSNRSAGTVRIYTLN